jgi:hypothetical protein
MFDAELRRLVNELLETPASEFGRMDVGLLNLVCAPKLPGSENLDIHRCLDRLDSLTAFARASVERNHHRFRSDPDYSHSEPMWRMSLLVTNIKLGFGAAYNPVVIAEKEAGITGPLADSRDMFIHGLLDDDPKRRWGTCASIPVLVTAVARRMGYPVGLTVAGRHVCARWEGGGTRFNAEASNPLGMTVPSDDALRKKIRPWIAGEETSGYYCRTLFPAEEFALFMTLRVESLYYAARYDEAMLWSARALQFAPDDPRFPHFAHHVHELALKHRLRRVHREHRIPSPDGPESFSCNVGDLLAVEERCLHMTIAAHYKEAVGELDEARQLYEDACRHNFFGDNEQRDLQRFLRKYDLRQRDGPLLPPRNLGQPRRMMPRCQPHEEAEKLRSLTDQFERNGELVKAHGALHDLYMFDPADAGVFQHARSIERHPKYQHQLKALVVEQRRVIERSRALRE